MASVCLAKLRAQFKIARRRKLFLSKGVVPFGSDPNGTTRLQAITCADFAIVTATIYCPMWKRQAERADSPDSLVA